MIHNRELFLNPAYLALIVGFVLQHATCFSLKTYRTNHKFKCLAKLVLGVRGLTAEFIVCLCGCSLINTQNVINLLNIKFSVID